MRVSKGPSQTSLPWDQAGLQVQNNQTADFIAALHKESKNANPQFMRIQLIFLFFRLRIFRRSSQDLQQEPQ